MAKLKGQQKLLAQLRRMADQRMVREVGAALFSVGEAIESEAAVSMTAGRAEVVDKRKHVPSKPGEPPAVLYGDLRRSLETVQVAPLLVETKAKDFKAKLLELGTSKMAARPFMAPAARLVGPDAVKLVNRAVDRALKKAFR